MTSVRYGERTVAYDIARADTLSGKVRIHVRPEGRVEVEAPIDADEARIRAAVQRRARWIVTHLESGESVRAMALPRIFVSGETHFYLGRRYPLRVIESREARSGVKLTRGRMEVTLRVADAAAVRRRLREWYRARARDYFSRRLALISDALPWVQGPPPHELITMAKQWGSCTPAGAIHLNPWLVRAPRHCIDYVITHELCHLAERKHGPRFIALLDRHCSEWRVTKTELDGLAELILADR